MTKVKQKAPISTELCCHPGCDKPKSFSYWSKDRTKVYYKKYCTKHASEHVYIKQGFKSSIEYQTHLAKLRGFNSYNEYEHYRCEKAGFKSTTDYQNSINSSYRRHRKDYCENIDSRLGYTCTTTIMIMGQLEIDHIDGNSKNNDITNLQTLCACCHRYKTQISKDRFTSGRKYYSDLKKNSLQISNPIL